MCCQLSRLILKQLWSPHPCTGLSSALSPALFPTFSFAFNPCHAFSYPFFHLTLSPRLSTHCHPCPCLQHLLHKQRPHCNPAPSLPHSLRHPCLCLQHLLHKREPHPLPDECAALLPHLRGQLPAGPERGVGRQLGCGTVELLSRWAIEQFSHGCGEGSNLLCRQVAAHVQIGSYNGRIGSTNGDLNQL